MNMLSCKAYAKVNLSLDVCGRREDGYHLLRSVMQQISLADQLSVRPSDRIELGCNLPDIPTDGRNIVCKVAKAYFDYTGIKGGAAFTLEKNVPSGAGVGGGSGDGAAAIKLLDQMYGTQLTKQQMIDIVSPIGADIPFFIHGGTALAEGIGEILTPLSPLKDCVFLLVKPAFSLSTPTIFKALDAMDAYPHPDTDGMVRAVQAGNMADIAATMGNSLQCVVAQQYPVISRLCDQLLSAGAMGAVMSGSGSTVFGLFDNEMAASRALDKLPFGDHFTYIAHPITE